MATEPVTNCLCNLCSGKIEFDPANAGQTINCPHCGMETVLFARPVEKQPNPPPVPVKRTPINNNDRIKQIREASCYPALRGLAKVALVLGYGVALLFLISGLAAAFGTNATVEGVARWVFLFGGVGAAMGIGILTQAAYEGAVIIVDIADVLISDSAGRRL